MYLFTEKNLDISISLSVVSSLLISLVLLLEPLILKKSLGLYIVPDLSFINGLSIKKQQSKSF